MEPFIDLRTYSEARDFFYLAGTFIIFAGRNGKAQKNILFVKWNSVRHAHISNNTTTPVPPAETTNVKTAQITRSARVTYSATRR
jgi:hypothetical protein